MFCVMISASLEKRELILELPAEISSSKNLSQQGNNLRRKSQEKEILGTKLNKMNVFLSHLVRL